MKYALALSFILVASAALRLDVEGDEPTVVPVLTIGRPEI